MVVTCLEVTYLLGPWRIMWRFNSAFESRNSILYVLLLHWACPLSSVQFRWSCQVSGFISAPSPSTWEHRCVVFHIENSRIGPQTGQLEKNWEQKNGKVLLFRNMPYRKQLLFTGRDRDLRGLEWMCSIQPHGKYHSPYRKRGTVFSYVAFPRKVISEWKYLFPLNFAAALVKVLN